MSSTDALAQPGDFIYLDSDEVFVLIEVKYTRDHEEIDPPVYNVRSMYSGLDETWTHEMFKLLLEKGSINIPIYMKRPKSIRTRLELLVEKVQEFFHMFRYMIR